MNKRSLLRIIFFKKQKDKINGQFNYNRAQRNFDRTWAGQLSEWTYFCMTRLDTTPVILSRNDLPLMKDEDEDEDEDEFLNY